MGESSFPRRALKATAHLADRLSAPERGIVIAIYHRVGAAGGGQMNLDPAVFSDQIAWLRDNRRIISLDQAVAELAAARADATPLDPAVVLTFDDGTADWLDVVAPILVAHDAPATFYLTTAYTDGTQPLPDGEAALSWTGVEELAATGIATIASHTHTHVLLDRLAPSAIAEELDRSIDLIGDHLGAAPRHFAYPKALPPSPAADSAVRERFDSAVLAGTRANSATADLHQLSRSPIQAADDERDAHAKFDGGLGFEDALRRRINTIRYRGKNR